MFERDHIREMQGYTPGFQPSGAVIKLNTNESPFAPGPRVMAALRAIRPAELQRYPDPSATAFRQAAARLHGLDPNQVVATNGGDELLRLAVSTFVDPGRAIGVVTPSYGVYSVLAALHPSPLSEAPMTEDWALPEEAATRWNDDGAQLALLTNPHAPSGALASAETIEQLVAAFQGVLVLDEAYVDFVDPALQHDVTALIGRCPNLLILRTMSKGYALAGLRLGYGLGDARLVEPIRAKTRDSYNVDVIAQRLGVAALEDRDHASLAWLHVRQERARVADELARIGFGVLPSQANFLLVCPPGSSSAQDLYAGLVEKGVFVRWFDAPRLRDKLRVTIGARQENDAFLAALRDVVGSTERRA